MSGTINLSHYLIILVSAVAVITDLRSGRIYNWLTLPTAVLGLILSSYYFGWSGAAQGLMGLLAGLVLYGWMFGLRILGGGDVKLLMALGACGGLYYTIEVALLGVILGGAMSFAVLIYKGKLFEFAKRLYWFFLTLLARELEPLPLKIDKTITMPFGIPISIAAVWAIFEHPLERWGIHLWF